MNVEQLHKLMFWRAMADDLAAVLAEQVRLTHDTPVSREALARYREARR